MGKNIDADFHKDGVSISVVSHGQGNLVSALLADIKNFIVGPIEVILTINIPETLPFSVKDYPYPIRVIENSVAKGFGENHNQAFAAASGAYFAVLNPDLRLNADPLPLLIRAIKAGIGVAAPLVRNVAGDVEDNARRFPTVLDVMCRAIAKRRATDYEIRSEPVYPDWVAGMFMLFPREGFSRVGGFDPRYFLYYEDVDICARLRASGLRVRLETRCEVIHDARRQSHSDLRYLRWHVASMLRFFATHPRLALPACRRSQA